MNEKIFKKLKGKYVKIGIKPNNYVLYGYIDEVFEDCVEFRTLTKTSFLDFDVIISITPAEGGF